MGSKKNMNILLSLYEANTGHIRASET